MMRRPLLQHFQQHRKHVPSPVMLPLQQMLFPYDVCGRRCSPLAVKTSFFGRGDSIVTAAALRARGMKVYRNNESLAHTESTEAAVVPGSMVLWLQNNRQ